MSHIGNDKFNEQKAEAKQEKADAKRDELREDGDIQNVPVEVFEEVYNRNHINNNKRTKKKNGES